MGFDLYELWQRAKKIVDIEREHSVGIFDRNYSMQEVWYIIKHKIAEHYLSSAQEIYPNVKFSITDNVSVSSLELYNYFNCSVFQRFDAPDYELCVAFSSPLSRPVANAPWTLRTFEDIYEKGELVNCFYVFKPYEVLASGKDLVTNARIEAVLIEKSYFQVA